MKKKTPLLGKWFLWLLLEDEDYSEILENFEEAYLNRLEASGFLKAYLWYWFILLKSIPAFTQDKIYWRIAMIKNYIKITMRNVLKHKGYSFINIMGLAVGLACFILISLYVQYEFSYDKIHENYDRIYRVINYQPEKKYLNSDYFTSTQGPLGPELMNRYPEVISAARLNYSNNVLISYGQSSFLENNFLYADPEIFKIFSFDLLKGDPLTALDEPNTVILSENMAEKYFGKEDPLGKMIRFQNSSEFRITGVLKNIPENSHLKMEFITSFQTFIDMNRWYTPERWNPGWFCKTYCLLKKNTDPVVFENKLVSLSEEIYEINHIQSKLVLQPLSKIHFSNINGEISQNTDMKYIYLFSSLACIILIIACINYMNLATARSTQRSKEVGIRKVAGAQRIQLVRQFIGESTVFTFLAFILSIILVLIVLPIFNAFFERNIIFHIAGNLQFILFLFVLVISTGVISGCYPALFISSFRPATALKTTFSKGSKSPVLRNILVVIQFSLSVILIISTLIVKNQLKYLQNLDVGYVKDRIIVLSMRDRDARSNTETIKTELLKNPNILKVSSSGALPNSITSFQSNWPVDHIGNKVTVYVGNVDYDFTDLYDIKIVQGRNFSRDFSSDENGAILVNEAAVQSLGWNTTLGKVVAHYGSPGRVKIVGIVNNFNFHSLHNKIKPMYLYLRPSGGFYMSVKIKANHIPGTIEFLEKQMKTFSPNYPFEYRFFDDVFDRAYREEQRMESMVGTFAFIAIIIGCLGLFGLAAFTAEQRTKEIGIRKVLGASVPNIVTLLSKDFVKLVFIANVIAWPVAYFVMNRWLQNFEYRTRIGIFIFILSAVLALIITFITIGHQSLKAAMSNPLDSLKYE